uniref:Si:ch1073-13h15.3 n=1 Tax=Cyprinus carpio TaxID=7962 RepID=A0A8C2JP11_CYPCA
MWLLIFLVCVLIWAGGTYWYLFSKPSPFTVESVRPPGPLELDQRKRDKVLKQGFTKEKIPKNLDAIVIGSGIGGMAAAATMAKAGKRVLVLEQHDVAGGCCHTFTEKGFEFDVGLHYFGQLHENGLLKVAMDQITEGQLEYVELPQHFDSIVIDDSEKWRDYAILSGKTEMEQNLKKYFPDDGKAVEEFFKIMKVTARKIHYLAILKLIPQWLALFLLKSGIADFFCSSIFHLSGMNATEMNNKLTSNKDLHVIFSYFFYGVPPKDSSFMINALMLHHFKRGAYYPKGGASEIPFHITKVIQKYGGSVLVRAPVSRILVDKKGAAYGVTVKKGDEHVEIRAPVIISNCGIFNTFQKLLPPEIQVKPEIQSRLDMMRPGKASFLLFSGFDATQEELDIVPNSIWLFKSNDMDAMMDEFFGMSKDEAPENIPMMLITFPSAKDSTSQIRHPGKSCMTILTMVNYEWFEEWKDSRVRKRGVDYYSYKMRFGNYLFEWACKHFPKLRDKLVYQEAATPLTNMHYLSCNRGAIYSADHNLDRFYAEAMARNRCDTPVKNLYLSGQDIFSCGIAGALHGGLLCASTVLNYPVYIDLLFVKKKLKWKKAKEAAKLAKQKQQ